LTRFSTLLCLVALAALTAVPAASASSIAYVAGDGNVHLVAPDGSRDVPITANATPDAKYRSPSQMDDGRIMAVGKSNGTSSFAFFFNRDGQMLTSWLLPSSGAGGFAPFTGAQASPDGGMIVYDYRHFDCSTNPCQGNQRVGFVAGPGQTNPCLINCHVGYLAPRWIPGQPYAAMVDQGFNAVYVQKQSSAFPSGWFEYGGEISVFGLDIRANRIVTSVGAGETEYMVLEQMTGPPPAVPQSQCSVSMPDNARPRLSPDGSMIAWSAPEGVMVSPTPTQTGGTETLCQLAPRLVAPGGKEPDWGVVDVPAAPVVPGGGTSQGGGGTAGAKVTTVAAPKLLKALSKGIVVGFRCTGACRVKATATVSKAIAKRFGLGQKKTKVGGGKSSLGKVGNGKVRIAFTPKAKSKLAQAVRVPVLVTLEISDGSGARRKLTKAVTLKR
jgi:hypothetical protein